jgi:hypothetical protein
VTRPHHYRESVIIRRSNEHNLVSIGTQDNTTEGTRCDLSRSGLLGGCPKPVERTAGFRIRREPPAESRNKLLAPKLLIYPDGGGSTRSTELGNRNGGHHPIKRPTRNSPYGFPMAMTVLAVASDMAPLVLDGSGSARNTSWCLFPRCS